MALMNCPECGKEMSDTISSCPHCGFKLSKNKKSKNEKKNNKKFILAGIISIVLVLIISTVVIIIATGNKDESEEVSANAQNSDQGYYTRIMEESLQLMSDSSQRADYNFRLIDKLWYSSIFDKCKNSFAINLSILSSGNEYLDTEYGYNNGHDIYWFAKIDEDQVEKFRANNDYIIENDTKVIKAFKDLKKGYDGDKDLYNEVLELYKCYSKIISSVKEPSGTYKDYSSSMQTTFKEFRAQQSKIKAMLP